MSKGKNVFKTIAIVGVCLITASALGAMSWKLGYFDKPISWATEKWDDAKTWLAGAKDTVVGWFTADSSEEGSDESSLEEPSSSYVPVSSEGAVYLIL